MRSKVIRWMGKLFNALEGVVVLAVLANFARRSFDAVQPVEEDRPQIETLHVQQTDRRLRISWWWAVSAIAVALILGLGFVDVFDLIVRPLALLVLAVTLATALDPVVNRLERRLPRSVAIIIVYLFLIILLVAFFWTIIPPVIAQAQGVANRLPDLIEQAQTRLDRFNQVSGVSIVDVISSQVGNLGSLIVSLPIAISTSLFEIVLVIFISFYWLLAQPSIRKFIHSLLPKGEQKRWDGILADMGGAMGGYVRGSAIDGFIVGIISYIGFLIIGVEFPLVLALLAGVLELLPTIGPIIAGAAAIGVALLQSTNLALIVLVFVVILQQVENHILVPNIMRTQTDISPLMTIIALYIGGTTGGLLGALVAIPLAAAFRVFVLRVVAPAIRERMGVPQHSSEKSES